MMLWDIIRDFFVKFVFGGMDSNLDVYNGLLGSSWYSVDGDEQILGGFATGEYYVNIGKGYDVVNGYQSDMYLGLGDWLSTTATIITLVALFIGITCLTIKLFKYVSNLFLLR